MSKDLCNLPPFITEGSWNERRWDCPDSGCGARWICMRIMRDRRPMWQWKKLPSGSPLNEHFDAAVSSSLRQRVRIDPLLGVPRAVRPTESTIQFHGQDVDVWQLSEERYHEVVSAVAPSVDRVVSDPVWWADHRNLYQVAARMLERNYGPSGVLDMLAKPHKYSDIFDETVAQAKREDS